MNEKEIKLEQKQNENQPKPKRIKKCLDIPSVNSIMSRRDQRRYYRAVAMLGIIEKQMNSGKRAKSFQKLMNRQRTYTKCQYEVARYLRTRARVAKRIAKEIQQQSKAGEFSITRPHDEVISDPLCVAVGGIRNGVCLPVIKEWPEIKFKLNELVAAYIKENKDAGPLPSYDSNEVHRGYRVIKCMDAFSKEFLFKCLTSMEDNWKKFKLVFIPAAEIPEGQVPNKHTRVHEPTSMKDKEQFKLAAMNFKKSLKEKTLKTPSFARKEIMQTKGDSARKQHSHISKNNPNFRGNSPLNNDVTEITNTPQYHQSLDRPENFPGNLLIKELYTAQHPQAYRTSTDFSLQSCSNAYDVPKDFLENPSFGQEFPSTSWQNQNYFNSGMESEFDNNKTSMTNRERNLAETQTLTNFEDWQRSPNMFANSGSSTLSKSYRDAPPRFNNPYSDRDDSLLAFNDTSRRSRERNSEDRRRFPDCFTNSGATLPKSYRDSPSRSRNPYRERDDRLPPFNETSRRSRERNSWLTDSKDWRRSPVRTKSYRDSPPRSSNSYRNRDDRFAASNETSRRSRERNSALNNSEDWRRSPDLFSKSSSTLTKYRDSPPRSSNPYRSRDDRWPPSNESSRRSRERNPDRSGHRSPEFNANSGLNATQYYQGGPSLSGNLYNVGEQESFRSIEFPEVTMQPSLDTVPNYCSQLDHQNNTTYGPTDGKFLPMDNYEKPPPPPEWRDINDEDDKHRQSSRRGKRRRCRQRRKL